MSSLTLWTHAIPWATLFLLGAWHGMNPGMGWLFAVALGMQEHSTRAVIRSLAPISLGHALAIGVVVLLAELVQIVLPLNYLRIVVAAALLALGIRRILHSHHFRWGGMQVGFRDLTIWSFLMASAHGAGLMVLPVMLQLAPASHAHMHAGGTTGFSATAVHTLGYLIVTAVVAIVAYRKLGLSMLRKNWFNLDLVWAVALIVTGGVALLI